MQVCGLSFCDVKGTRHVARDSVELSAGGVAGDRRFAVVDADSRAVLKTVRHPELTLLRASCVDGTLAFHFPDGTVASQSVAEAAEAEKWTVDYWGRQLPARPIHGIVSEALADYLGRKVTLVESGQPTGFVYGAPVSLWFTRALTELGDRLGAPVDPRRFRLTIGIDDGEQPVDEARLVGRVLRIGSAEVEVTEQIGRCPIVDWDPESSDADQRVLATLAEYRRQGQKITFGVAGRVLRGSVVRRGAPITRL